MGSVITKKPAPKGARRPRYEPPALVDLGAIARAVGARCTNGTGVTGGAGLGICTSGGGARGHCRAGGGKD